MLKPEFLDQHPGKAVEALAGRDRGRRPGAPRSARPGARRAQAQGRCARPRLSTRRCCSTAARSSCGALQARPAQLQRVRREARVQGRAHAGAGQLPRRAPRPADLRGHVDAGRLPECLVESGAEILIVINGSPYEMDKTDVRLQLGRRPGDRDRPAADLRQPGRRPGRAGVRRRVLRARRRLQPAAQLPACSRRPSPRPTGSGARTMSGRCADAASDAAGERPWSRSTRRCMLGLRDYVDKNGFPGVVLGCRAASIRRSRRRSRSTPWAPERVHCVMMPSPYTSQESLEDAAEAPAPARRPARRDRHRTGHAKPSRPC